MSVTIQEVASGKYMQFLNENKAKEKKMIEEDSRGTKKEDRRKKAAGGKAGGGTQGRETKTKSTKKKYMKKDKDDWSESEEEVVVSKTIKLEFMPAKEIEKELKKNEILNDCPTEMISGIAAHLFSPLQEDYEKSLKVTYEKYMNEKCGKKSQEELLEKLFKMNAFLDLYLEGLSLFDGDVKSQLEKYLLRSFCVDITAAAEEFLLLENLVSETKSLPRGVQESLQGLSKGTVQSYETTLRLLLPPEKKSSKALNSKENIMKEALKSLLDELKSTGEQAIFLHLSCLILFAKKTNTLLQASGKFVPIIINFLDGKTDDVAILRTFQENVVTYIRSKNMDENSLKILRELQPKLLEFVERVFNE